MIVVNTMYPSCYERLEVTSVDLTPFESQNQTSERPCHKLFLNDLPRRRLGDCFAENPEESLIDECGRGTRHKTSLFLVFFISFLCLVEIL